MSLINGVSQIAPFDPAAKQALLEARQPFGALRTAGPADAILRHARRTTTAGAYHAAVTLKLPCHPVDHDIARPAPPAARPAAA
jgi:hypothetical protein